MEKVRIILIEENAQDYLNIRQLLDEQTSALSIDWAPNYEIALKRIKQNTYDVYLVGYDVNQAQEQFLNWLYKYTTVPIILLTKTGESIEQSYLDQHQTDFIPKDQLNWVLLKRIIRYLIHLQAWQRGKQYFQTIFDNALQLMILVNSEGILQEINQAAVKFFNAPKETLVGSLVWELSWLKSVPPDQALLKTAILQAAQGEFSHCEVQTSTSTSQSKVVDFSFTPISNVNNGEIEWILIEGGDLSDYRTLEQQLSYTHSHDQLTGLPNRHWFLEYLDQAINRVQSSKDKHIAVLFMDLDRFRIVNASLGHDMGDWLLMEVAQRLQGCLKKEQVLARFGGDEFMVLLDEMNDLNEATRLAGTINHVLATPFSLDGYEIITSASIGIAYYTDQEDSTDLLRDADAAVYRAKTMGKSCYVVFSRGMHTQAISRLQDETDLHQAIEDRRFILLYQPQMNLASEQLISTESIIRFAHPHDGFMSSINFKPILEDTGIIVSIEEWMLQTACHQLKTWLEAGLVINRITVKLSILQFRNKRLINMVADSIKGSGLTPECLELELTEHVLQDDLDLTVKTLKCFKDMGIWVTIDDFGMGYAPLNYLKRFPVDSLKINKFFIKGIISSPEDTAITVATIDMAHALGLTVIAKGVETTEQRDFLRDHGCDFAQGYLYAGPMEHKVFLEWGKQYHKMVNKQ